MTRTVEASEQQEQERRIRQKRSRFPSLALIRPRESRTKFYVRASGVNQWKRGNPPRGPWNMTEMASKHPPRHSFVHIYHKLFYTLIQNSSKHMAQGDCSYHLDCFFVLLLVERGMKFNNDGFEGWKKKDSTPPLSCGIDGLPENRSWAVPCEGGNFWGLSSAAYKMFVGS